MFLLLFILPVVSRQELFLPVTGRHLLSLCLPWLARRMSSRTAIHSCARSRGGCRREISLYRYRLMLRYADCRNGFALVLRMACKLRRNCRSGSSARRFPDIHACTSHSLPIADNHWRKIPMRCGSSSRVHRRRSGPYRCGTEVRHRRKVVRYCVVPVRLQPCKGRLSQGLSYFSLLFLLQQ